MPNRGNIREQAADDQMDVDASSTNSATGEQRCEDRLSNEFQHRLSCKSQENPGPSSANSDSVWHSTLNKSIANTASDEVMEKAAFFVKAFVGEFEEKLSEYSKEAKPGSKVKKKAK